MKCRDRDVSIALNMEVARLQVHIRWLRPARANLFKHLAEIGFKFWTAVRPLRKAARVEHRGIVVEKPAKPVPFEVVKGSNKILEHGLGRAGGGRGVELVGFRCESLRQAQYENTESFPHRQCSIKRQPVGRFELAMF